MDFSINECDGELRIELPNLQNEKAILESRPAANQPEQLLASHLNQHTIFSLRESQPDEMTLNWSPIPRQVMHKELKQEIVPAHIPKAMVSNPDCAVRSDQLLWKEPGPRLLDIDDDDELETNVELEVDEELGVVTSGEADQIMPVKTATESSKSPNDSFSQRLSPQGDMISRRHRHNVLKAGANRKPLPNAKPVEASMHKHGQSNQENHQTVNPTILCHRVLGFIS
ncbi:hypothetical protein DV736_g997, partial [Chaetothyriales sp. CBS 134916]